MTRQQALAEAVLDSRTLIARYFKGFDDSNHTTQAADLPNHFAWTLGHLALTLHRTAEKFEPSPQALPDADFVTGDGSGGSADTFDTESVCFGSAPTIDASRYPRAARCIEIFSAAIERCAAAIRSCSDEQLEARIAWGKAEVPLWTLAGRMVFHVGTHCGQLADLRRALRMGSIFS